MLMTGLVPNRRRRGGVVGGAVAIFGLGLAALLAGCGGVAGGNDDLGYPALPTKISRAAALVADVSGERLRVPVPAGWGLAKIDKTAPPGVSRALVIRTEPCYLSIAITGSSVRPLTVHAIYESYDGTSDGYDWDLERYGKVIVSLLDQTSGTHLSRSTVGSAYVPVDASDYLAVDIGAGVWPIGSAVACPDPDVAARLGELRSTVETVFAAMVVTPAAADSASAAVPVTAASPAVLYARRRGPA